MNTRTCRNCGDSLDSSRYFNCKKCVLPSTDFYNQTPKIKDESRKTCGSCQELLPKNMFFSDSHTCLICATLFIGEKA